MEVHFPPELQEKIDRVAAETQRDSAEYVQELVEHYLEYDAWLRQKVTHSLARLDAGEFLTHEEVGERLERMFKTK